MLSSAAHMAVTAECSAAQPELGALSLRGCFRVQATRARGPCQQCLRGPEALPSTGLGPWGPPHSPVPSAVLLDSSTLPFVFDAPLLANNPAVLLGKTIQHC